MKAPHKPRGEKPATTIRLLRRQIDTQTNIIAELRSREAIQTEAQKRAEDRAHSFEIESDFLEEQLASAKSDIRALESDLIRQDLRLAFLEGYYAKSTEPAHALPIHQTDGREREGDAADPPRRPETGPPARAQELASWYDPPLEREIRRYGPRGALHREGRAMEATTGQARPPEADEYVVGPVRDGTPHPQRDEREDRGADRPIYRR